jgi:hypothetical protein
MFYGEKFVEGKKGDDITPFDGMHLRTDYLTRMNYFV